MKKFKEIDISDFEIDRMIRHVEPPSIDEWQITHAEMKRNKLIEGIWKAIGLALIAIVFVVVAYWLIVGMIVIGQSLAIDLDLPANRF